MSVRAGGLHLSDCIRTELIKISVLKLALIHSVKHKCIVDINTGNLTVLNAHYHVALALKQTADGISTHLGRGKAVTKRRRTASYDMTETRELSLNTRSILKLLILK